MLYWDKYIAPSKKLEGKKNNLLLILLEFYNPLIMAVDSNSHITDKTESQNFM